MKSAMKMQAAVNESNGGRLVAADGRTLPLRGAVLRAEARAGIARVVLEQRFANPYAEPLAVTYVLPLPADGAVSGYAFTVGERRIVGEVDRRAAARERYEEAIINGQSAAIVDEERSSLFTQEIGNIPPGVELVAELTLDQKLAWLDEGAWEWRFPTVAMPRYQGADGRVADAARVRIDVAEAALPARIKLSLAVRDAIVDGRKAESPSHALTLEPDGTIMLAADGGARLDRDLVVRWPVAQAQPGVTLAVTRPAADRANSARAYGLLTLVPPSLRARTTGPVARDLCLLIDTSGSMGGEPLDQARRVLAALIDTLGDGDTLEMIEFSNRARRWKKEPLKATQSNRNDARKWLAALNAGGGTEMREGLMEALAPLRAESQRQIVLVSDGAIGFEAEIVADILAKLPAGSRLHTVGVGSGVNRSLTQPAARAGRGIEVIIGLGEDPERAAKRICARTAEPMLVDVRLEGSALLAHAPARLPDLFSGAPALLSVALRPEGGELTVRGRGAEGEWSQRIHVAPVDNDNGNNSGDGGVAALFARESVEDLEMRRAAAGSDGNAIDREIEQLGIDFQIATRLTSWLAIDEERSVDPTRPTRRERIPQELPYGVSVEGLGLRACAPPMMPAPAPMMMRGAFIGSAGAAGAGAPPAPPSGSAPQRTRAMAPSAKSASSDGSADSKKGSGESGGGIFNALGKLFKKESADAPSEPLADMSPRKPMPTSAAPLSIARGRVLQHRGELLVIEIEVPGDFSWTLDGDAWIDDDHGGHTRGTIDVQRSTAPQSVSAGQLLRLTLTLGAPLPGSPTVVSVGAWRIQL